MLNHIMKSSDIELAHTNTIRAQKRLLNEQTHERILRNEAKKNQVPYVPNESVDLDTPITIPTYQDQGFTRPTVLLLCPYRYYAHLIAHRMLSLLPKKVNVFGRSKFDEEFGDEETKEETGKAPYWKAYFPGNNDDCFRVGISYRNRTFRFYTDFYNSDFIIASPLSLKQIEERQGWDYLSSIEVLVVYGADMIAMQNVDHLRGVIGNMNQTLTKNRNTDFSRLRESFLSDMQKYCRQSVFIGTVLTSPLLGLFHRECFNPLGRLEIRPIYDGAVSDILSPPRQLFLRLACNSATEASSTRVKYLEGNVLKVINNAAYKKILIYCDNYFEYVYVKRLLMENCDERECGVIDEYMTDSSNSRNKSYFDNGTIRVLLFSGRFEYFKRMKIRNAQTIYFVSPPSYPNFYSEFVNNMNYGENEGKELSVGVTLLYTKFDTFALERIVGTSRYKKMLTGKRDMYLFC